MAKKLKALGQNPGLDVLPGESTHSLKKHFLISIMCFSVLRITPWFLEFCQSKQNQN